MLVIQTAGRCIAVCTKRFVSERFFIGAVAGAAFITVALHQTSDQHADLVLAFTLVPVTGWTSQIAVVAAAVVSLIGFLLWSKRTTSAAFFRGVLAGMGFVLSVDIVWVHWIFGLHHITNTQMDLVLEPLFVFLGLVFLWFAITRERRLSS
jgi:hypothetical protein